MRQSGIIAAGALYALEHHRERLCQDHANAKRLAEGLREMPGIDVEPEAVETNIVFFRVTSIGVEELLGRLKEQTVLMLPIGPGTIRAVTHLDVSGEQIEQTLRAFAKVLDK